MDDMGNNNGKKNFDMRFIKGLAAVTLGVILIIMSYKVILWMVCFMSGLFLIYAGLIWLDLTPAVRSIDQVIEKIKKMLSL